MRRFALIDNYNGNIEYEGVWIEGKWILKNVSDDGLMIVYDIPTKYERYAGFVLVYKDDETDEWWIPREDCKKDDEGYYHYV
jgi:hypothetical protein